MTSPKRKPKAPADPTTFSIRGLTEADNRALERAIARRKAMLGGAFVSQNSAILGLLRAAMAAEDAADPAGDTSRTGGT